VRVEDYHHRDRVTLTGAHSVPALGAGFVDSAP